MANTFPKPKPTHLRDYYDALGALQEGEQTVLAENHAKNPTPLIHRFRESIKTLEGHPDLSGEHFHEGVRTKPQEPPTPIEEISRTIDFASHLSDGKPRVVEGVDELAFRYIDRELFLRRTTGRARVPARTLDLLLASVDGRPILAELKIGADRLPYFALIQLLMYASEAVVPSQRQRLRDSYTDAEFRWPTDGPFVDLYLIAFKPANSSYGKHSLGATDRIAAQLLEAPDVSQYVRRIAYLEAVPADGALRFERHFAYPAT